MSSPFERSPPPRESTPPRDPPALLGETSAGTLRDLIKEKVREEIFGAQPPNPIPADNPETGERV